MDAGTAAIQRINIATGENGVAFVDNEQAAEGDLVTITVKPEEGYTLGRLLALDEGGNPLALLYQDEEQYAFIMPQGEVDILPVFAERRTVGAEFADVAADAYYSEAVKWSVEQGIAKGTDADTFSPHEVCTRVQLVTFLWRAAGSPEPETQGAAFADVNEEDYSYKAILWALENGITSGTSPFRFSPDETVDRAQAVSFLYRAAGKPAAAAEIAFRDVHEGDYFADAVAWAQQNGITGGTGDGAFSPNEACDRAQIVTMLYRFLY